MGLGTIRGTWIALLALLALAGCGRLAFDFVEDGTHRCEVTPTAFLASPLVPPSACNPDGVLTADDGQYAGLDLIGGVDQDCAPWDGADACGCVGIDLGAEHAISHLVVRAAPTNQACTQPCSGSECNSGHTFPVYAGTTQGTYSLAGHVRFTTLEFADYIVPLGASARYVVACRDGWSANQDDVVVDAITAVCE